MLYAGIDLGTSGCRLVVIDAHGDVRLNTKIQYQPQQQQTPSLWWNSVKKLLSEMPLAIKADLVALAINGTSGTILLTDAKGNPSSSVLMYHDLRATSEAQIIQQKLPQDNGAQGAASSLSRLLWLLKHETNRASIHALHQADYILAKMARQVGISDENNCLKLGYDVVNRCWPDAIQELGFPIALLPQVHPAGTPVNTIDSKLANTLGLNKGLQLVAGTTDSIAAFIATGANKLGDAVTSLGSTLVLKLLSDKPVFAPQYGVYSHRLNDMWLLGGASNSGGNVLLNYFNQEQLQSLTPQLNPEKLISLGYYPLTQKGERFPFADPDKIPKVQPRPDSDVDFMQAILEGIADIEALGYQRLSELGAATLTSVRSVGGGSKNKAWSAIREQKLKVPVSTPFNTEAAYGSALLALSSKNK